jgi:hypothetical protein
MITSSHTRALTYNLPASTTPGPKFHLLQNVEDWRPSFNCAQIQQLLEEEKIKKLKKKKKKIPM